MRTFFLKRNTGIKTRNHWLSFALALGFMAFANISNAQVDMSWTGASSNNFVIEDNWDPAGSPEGNNVTIPMPDTTSATGSPDAQPFAVEVTGAENISVNIMEIVYATENAYQSTFTVNLDNDETTFTNSTRDADYNHTGVIIKRGHYMYTRGNGARFDSDNSWLRVEGGIAEYYNLLMGNGNSPSSGGKLYISGGEVRLNDTFGRIYTGREDGQVEITGDGMLTISGNFIAPTENWINGGEDYSIKRGYDAVADKTTYTAVPASYIGIENSDRQVLKSGEASTDTLHLIQTSSVVDATTFEWRYRAEGQETYTSFTDDNSATFAPQFDTPGTFFVSCLVDGVETENEVEFFVVSNAISFSPAEFPVQFVRIGENGTEITAEFTTTPTSMEWKYSHTPGGPYVSFDPVQTSATLAPSFEETGNTYVVMIAQIDGATHTSVELFYNVEEESTSGKSLTWTGLASEEGTNPANWNPVANPYKNSLAIGAFDSPSTLPYPVYEPVGNDTISTFWVGPGAKMTINSQDTVNIRGGWQQAQGNLIIQNGIITNSGYFRLDRATGKVELYNDSKMFIEQLLMGERSTDGGTIHLNDNAVLHCLTLPGRVSPDTLQSVTYISDNASIEYVGDVQSDVNVWISSAKIVCPDENFEPYVTFDGELTIVTARNTNAFAIENASLDFTTPNTPISEDISLVNVDGITSWEWKWSESVNGPW
nr:hypothetical protein [Prolixibacteraceae bacterium]